MPQLRAPRVRLLARCATVAVFVVPSLLGPVARAESTSEYANACSRGSPLCPDVNDSSQVFGRYVGHDEPSLLFYSNAAGSGNSTRYQVRLPEEPPILPNASGTGGTFNFQLRPELWFGMALCDTESSPNPGTKSCPASSDANIFDGVDPGAADYVGNHPGTALVEVQFYPPGWVPWPAAQIINGGTSCDPRQWCAAILVFSLQLADNTLTLNNAACQNLTGIESFNFAFITRDGTPQGPPSPLFQTTADTFTPHHGRTLFMNPGDNLTLDLHDSANGLQVDVHDLTTEQSGSMTASAANGFQQVVFDPNATKCTSRPYSFHPMYATSSEHTRVPWSKHGYNVAFSDEIGHFEYCPSVAGTGLGDFNCTSKSTPSDPRRRGGTDGDDQDSNCAPASMSTLVKIGGCTGVDDDFDGPSYQTVWPGSTRNVAAERRSAAQPIRFTSPLFNGNREYSRVAFEANMPAIEATCDIFTGAGCTNPPAGAQFYPLFTTVNGLNAGLAGEDARGGQRGGDDSRQGCAWQFGGPFLPGTTNTFGGTSTSEYSTSLLQLAYPRPTGPSLRFNNYRRVLNNNPCRARTGDGDGG